MMTTKTVNLENSLRRFKNLIDTLSFHSRLNIDYGPISETLIQPCVGHRNFTGCLHVRYQDDYVDFFVKLLKLAR